MQNPYARPTGYQLGLNRQQRIGFNQAQQAGNLDQFLAAHPNIQNRYNASPRAQLAQSQQRVQQGITNSGMPVTAAPSGMQAPATPPQSPMQSPMAPPPPTTTGNGNPPNVTSVPPPQFSDVLNQQFGLGNPFQPSNLFGDPLQTAQDRANYLLKQNLAGIREKFGSGGMGNSDRAALAQGSATGEAGSALGQYLAQLGVQQRGNDLDRTMSGLLNLGNQDISRQQLALSGLQQLGNLGVGLTGIGKQDQLPSLLDYLAPFLGNFSRQDNQSYTRT